MASLESLIASLDTPTPNLSALIAALRQFKGGALGGGRLTKSGSNLLLSPYRGNVILINSKLEEIPDAGVALAPTGLIPTTTFRSRTSNVATLTTASAHELIVNDWVDVTSVGGSGYNALAQVASTPTTTTFTYANTGGDEGSTADTAGRIACDRYAYVYMNSGVMTMEARGRLIAHSAQAGTGAEIATSDATRSLAGLVRIIAGPAWADTDTQRFVRSWAHRVPLVGTASFTADRTTTSTSFVEINTEIRVHVLAWPDETVTITAMTQDRNSGANFNLSAIGLDGTAQSGVKLQSGTSAVGAALTIGAQLAEGYHLMTLMGRVTAGTGTWESTNATERCRLRVLGA